MTITDWIQFFALIIAFIGLITTLFFSIRQNKNVLKQMQINFYADYTKRYQDILINLPEIINEKDFSFDKLKPEVKMRTMRYMRAYFDLCYEEYNLHRKELIDEEIWDDWEKGIASALKKTAFTISWMQIANDTSFSNEFYDWIERRLKP